RGLPPALAVLRIKQAISATRDAHAPVRVVLGEDCGRDRVSLALGEAVGRLQYADAPGPEPTRPWWQRRDHRDRDRRLHQGVAGGGDGQRDT
ncbi:hypothetical protein K7G98_39600, partial [Saccharothrix sp. MB29]|nr:hypothetical protein [Saccharothrix sp. MB29]